MTTTTRTTRRAVGLCAALIVTALLTNTPFGIAVFDSAEVALFGAEGSPVYCSSEIVSAAGCSSAAAIYARQRAEIVEAHREGRAWLTIEELRHRARFQKSGPGVIGMTDWRAVQ